MTAIWRYRHFWRSLVVMDLRTRYRRSVLGIGWSLLNPILMTVVFCAVFASWFGNGDWRHYAPYFLIGISIWEFLKLSVTQGCLTFVRNEAYIRQSPLPPAIYTLRTILGFAIHLVLALAVGWLSAIVLRPDDWAAPFRAIGAVVPAVLLLVVFGWAISAIAAFATVYFHDMQQISEVGFSIAFFLTPIMYPVALLQDRGLGVLVDWNPAAVFFRLIRDPILAGSAPAVPDVVRAVTMTIAVVLTAVTVIARCERKLIFRL